MKKGGTLTWWIPPNMSNDNKWHYVATIFDGTKIQTYFDGDKS